MDQKPLIPAHWTPARRRTFKVLMIALSPALFTFVLIQSVWSRTCEMAWWVRSDMRMEWSTWREFMRS